MAGEPNPAPTRRGGRTLGLNPFMTYRPIAGFVPAAQQPLSARDKADLEMNYRLPGWGMRLGITVFRTRSAGDVRSYFAELLDTATKIFGPHGLNLAVRDLTQLPMAGIDGPVTSSDDINQLIAQLRGGGLDGLLKVVFCARQTANSTVPASEAGLTVRDAQQIPYVLINSQASNPDRVTLAHEIGHAAGLHHELQSVRSRYGYGAEAYLRSRQKQPEANFMSDTNHSSRTDMFAFQVHKLSVAMFASPGNV